MRRRDDSQVATGEALRRYLEARGLVVSAVGPTRTLVSGGRLEVRHRERPKNDRKRGKP